MLQVEQSKTQLIVSTERFVFVLSIQFVFSYVVTSVGHNCQPEHLSPGFVKKMLTRTDAGAPKRRCE